VVELISFKVTAIGRREPLDLARAAAGSQRELGTRDVFFRGLGFVPTSIVHRSALQPGDALEGPAVIEEEGSTTLVEPGMTVEQTENGSLLILVGAQA
jgi:N-methylhydantoinase A/oxoprolinase/acetone carboxylase beta subunit